MADSEDIIALESSDDERVNTAASAADTALDSPRSNQQPADAQRKRPRVHKMIKNPVAWLYQLYQKFHVLRKMPRYSDGEAEGKPVMWKMTCTVQLPPVSDEKRGVPTVVSVGKGAVRARSPSKRRLPHRARARL